MRIVNLFALTAVALVGCVSGSTTPLPPSGDDPGTDPGTMQPGATAGTTGTPVGSGGSVGNPSGGQPTSSGGSVNPGGGQATTTGGTATTAGTGSGGRGGTGSGGGPLPIPQGGSAPVLNDGHTFYPKPVLRDYESTAWLTFKGTYIMDCGNGQSRVASNGNETVSEGIGYGLLLAVANADRTTFDSLLAYYKARRKGDGLMNWKYDACTMNVTGANSATDADLDAAMALIQAQCKWGAYQADATALISAIKSNEVDTSGAQYLLKPGDSFGTSAASCVNPSYFAPGYYQAFANFSTADATFWTRLRTDTYTVLNRASNAATGLVPDWADANGNPGGSCPLSGNKYYEYDAARTPWRIATDWVWFGNTTAQTWLKRVAAFANGKGIGNVLDGYYLDGTNKGQYHNSTFTGGFALAAMADSQALSDSFGTGFVGIPAMNDAMYFHSALRALYMVLATGMSVSGCAH